MPIGTETGTCLTSRPLWYYVLFTICWVGNFGRLLPALRLVQAMSPCMLRAGGGQFMSELRGIAWALNADDSVEVTGQEGPGASAIWHGRQSGQDWPPWPPRRMWTAA